jgi:hypothetical protein
MGGTCSTYEIMNLTKPYEGISCEVQGHIKIDIE